MANGHIVVVIWCIALKTSLSYVLSGSFENHTFYHGSLVEYPSKLVTIEYMFKKLEPPENDIQFNIYTTEDDMDFLTKCSNTFYGQLQNENLRTPLTGQRYKNAVCEYNSDQNIISCYGKITIQDHIPRYYTFAFGFKCNIFKTESLKGLVYNITVYDQRNKTECIRTQGITNMNCSKFYAFTTFPNYVGSLNVRDGLELLTFMDTCYQLTPVVRETQGSELFCSKHFAELICSAVFPKCDNGSSQLIVTCKETCENFAQCLTSLRLDSYLQFLVNCSYLPSVTGSIPCYYKPVTCETPPNVANAATVRGINESMTHLVKSQVEYVCQDSDYEMVGNGTIECLPSGTWSQIPICMSGSGSPLKIVLPLFFGTFGIYLISLLFLL